MVLIVFLLAYLIRRQLDTNNRLTADKLWRHWFHRADTVKAGHETSVIGGLMLVVLPALVAGLGIFALDAIGWQIAGYPGNPDSGVIDGCSGLEHRASRLLHVLAPG